MTSKSCTRCNIEKDITDFTDCMNKVLKTCIRCRDYQKELREKSKIIKVLKIQCEEDGGDWDQVKEDLGIIDKSKLFPPDAIPCQKCHKVLPESEFSKSSNIRRRNCRPYCKECDKEHRLRNKDWLTQQLECPYCNIKVKRSWHSEHLKLCIKNPNKVDQTQLCEICKIEFKTVKTYENHLLTKGHIKKIQLNIILKPEEVYNAITTLKSKIKPPIRHICYRCVSEFESTDLLETHSCQNSIELPVICFLCKKVNRDFSDLKRHVRTHFNFNITCPLCNTEISERKWRETHAKKCVKQILSSDYPGKSSYEKWVFKFLTLHNFEFEREKKFSDLIDKIPLPYDFYLSKLNILIEVHGKQHYEQTNRSYAEEKFVETIAHDKMKFDYAKKNNIKLYTIDCRKINSYSDIEKLLAIILEVSEIKPSKNDFFLNSEIYSLYGEILGLEYKQIKKPLIVKKKV